MSSQLSKTNIQHIKLSNGHEIFALVTKEEDSHMEIEGPMALVGYYEGGFHITEYFPASNLEESMTLKREDVVLKSQLSDEAKRKYLVTINKMLTGVDLDAADVYYHEGTATVH